MSELDDDIARGCLENGEPIEAKWGSGWWSVVEEQQQEPPTDMDIWNDLQWHLEKLTEENEKLSDENCVLGDTVFSLISTLESIYDLVHTSQEMHEIFVLVDNALNEVTK